MAERSGLWARHTVYKRKDTGRKKEGRQKKGRRGMRMEEG
jgi:hypothetical protein